LATESPRTKQRFDLGHQGDVDYTLIAKLLAMTPTERLRHHERWRQLLARSQVIPNFVEEMVVRLTDAQVEFVIVGGVSAILQGASITTRDLDICYRRTPANIARLVAALNPLHPRPRGFPPDLPFVFDERTVQLGANFTLDVGNEALDLLGEMSAIGGYEEVIDQAADVTVAGRSVKALALVQLIATKEAAGRIKDLAALPDIRAALELQRRQDSSPDEPPAGP
jgi:predicted nucleotidyltransferase